MTNTDNTTLVTFIYNCLKGGASHDKTLEHAMHLIHCQYASDDHALSYHPLHVIAMTQAAQALKEAQEKIDEEYSLQRKAWLEREAKHD